MSIARKKKTFIGKMVAEQFPLLDNSDDTSYCCIRVCRHRIKSIAADVYSNLSASMAFMLPVATPTNTIIFSGGRITIFEMARTGFLLNLAGVIIISLCIYFLGNLLFDLETFPLWAKP